MSDAPAQKAVPQTASERSAELLEGTSLWDESWKRLKKNRLAMLSVGVVWAMFVLGYSSPLLSRYFTHFSLDEQHTNLAYSPPGALDISLDHPSYDGEDAWFEFIDADADGFITCELEPLPTFAIPTLRELERLEFQGTTGADGRPETVYDRLTAGVLADTAALEVPFEEIMSVHLGSYECPEVDRLNKLFRFFDFLFSTYDVVPGDTDPTGISGIEKQPDGFISRREYPQRWDQVEKRYRGHIFLGDEGFEVLDLDQNGYLIRSEVVWATRYLRIGKHHLLSGHDKDGDLRISRAEFPGAPELHRFWLGTDGKGRDVLTRMFYGARISITIGLLATLVSFLIGVTYGAIAGYFGGRVDNVMMRIVDVLYGLPFMFLVIILIVWVGRSTVNLFIALGAVQWLTMSRVVRGQVISLRHREFVEAAEAMGLGRLQIIFKHLLRNTVGPVIVYSTLMVPAVIREEALLSFIGLGVQPPDPSWGNMISEGASRMQDFTWLIVYPGLALALTLFSMNFLGDGIRDALDPQMKKT